MAPQAVATVPAQPPARAPVFVLSLSRPSPTRTADRRSPSGNWILHASPSPSVSDEKLAHQPALDADYWGSSAPAPMATYLSPYANAADMGAGKRQYKDPATLEAGALELGLPSPLPQYCHEADEPNEPDTIAKKLFVFGFMFPLLWLVGACILCVPLRAYPLPEPAPPLSPDAALSSSSTSSSATLTDAPAYTPHAAPRPANLDTVWTQGLVDLYGRAERHWAWRCVWALCALGLIGVAVVCALAGSHVI
ncbi:hypothetical protein CALCODRAFT_512018 [Calocera cornea HHB12733]|uniref:Uncharacterized protein n=1 Tax=Calocera cornea HHB12733 TaxID=1353952 RepID=A0A165DCH9_9BASI|nr:hypothetical protein CALCODRAFT_512018 [Calocera cornea HHB12733]